MSVRITLKGFTRTLNYFKKLPKKLDMHLSKENKQFMDQTATIARQLCPVDTGALRESIVVEPAKKSKNTKIWKLIVKEPYGIFQEEGFSPHWTYIQNSSKMAPGVYFVSKFTPFVEPALRETQLNYLNSLQLAANRAIAN